jgi:serine/threonine protein kinase
MGTVWVAQPTKSERQVVVKEALINRQNDMVKIERLLVEAAILRTVNDELTLLTSDENQQVIRAHAVGYVDQLTDPAHPLLVLEYVEGPTLSLMCGGKPLKQSIALRHISDLLKVVEALHSKGLIHRDISPSNIILNPVQGIVIIDFGTSLLIRGTESKRSPSGRVVFKRGFSAPELLDARSDIRSDIFSVGATIFYILTGRNPADFSSKSGHRLTKALREVNPETSTWLSDLVSTAMSPEPERRFRSAAEMRSTMEAHLAPRPSHAPRITLAGSVYELNAELVDIGREHSCDESCNPPRSSKVLQIRITDPERFIEKHHARIWVDDSGECSIEDLRSANRTAIRHAGGPQQGFKVLTPFAKEKLQHEDIVALAYSPSRGPYVSFVLSLR